MKLSANDIIIVWIAFIKRIYNFLNWQLSNDKA